MQNKCLSKKKINPLVVFYWRILWELQDVIPFWISWIRNAFWDPPNLFVIKNNHNSMGHHRTEALQSSRIIVRWGSFIPVTSTTTVDYHSKISHRTAIISSFPIRFTEATRSNIRFLINFRKYIQHARPPSKWLTLSPNGREWQKRGTLKLAER